MSTLKVMALLAAAVALREYQHRPAPRPAGETRVAAAPAVAFGP